MVQGPAIGLLITGMLNWLVVPVIVVVMAYQTLGFGSGPMTLVVPLIAALFASLFFSGFVIFAALKMKQLEGYELAIAAGVLAELISPSNVIGLAIGIWSLVVLSRADVRAAFTRRRQERVPPQPATPRERKLGVAALVLSVAAFPLALGVAMSVESRKMALISFVLLLLIGLICGLAGRRSVAAKLAICLTATILALGSVVIALTLVRSLRHDFGGTPTLESLPNGSQEGPARTAPPVVTVGQPAVREVRDYEDFTGTIEAAKPAELRSQVYVSFDVDERTVLRLARMGYGKADRALSLPISCGLTDDQGFPHPAKLDFISPSIDPATGTARWRAVLPNPDGILMPGMFARVRLTESDPHKALLVPEKALLSDQGTTFLFVVNKQNVAERRKVVYELFSQILGLE